MGKRFRPPLAGLALVVSLTMLASCGKGGRSGERDPDSRPGTTIPALDAQLREELGFPPPKEGLEVRLQRLADGLSARDWSSVGVEDKVLAIRMVLEGSEGMVPVLTPGDAELVPSLSLEGRRGGCVSQAVAWQFLATRVGWNLQPILLPGHVALRDDHGRWVETLRGGIERDDRFYDSAFQLARRPWYQGYAARPSVIEAAMLVQLGLLRWRHGKTRSAEEAFRQAVLLVPGMPEAEGNLGLLLAAMKVEDSARIHLDRALQGDSLNAKARSILEGLGS